jgi:hypothetical protein
MLLDALMGMGGTETGAVRVEGTAGIGRSPSRESMVHTHAPTRLRRTEDADGRLNGVMNVRELARALGPENGGDWCKSRTLRVIPRARAALDSSQRVQGSLKAQTKT